MTFDRQAFLEAIELRRIACGLSWRELAKQMNMNHTALSRFSHGSGLRDEHLVRLAIWADLDLRDFTIGGRAGSDPSQATAADPYQDLYGLLFGQLGLKPGQAQAVINMTRLLAARDADPRVALN